MRDCEREDDGRADEEEEVGEDEVGEGEAVPGGVVELRVGVGPVAGIVDEDHEGDGEAAEDVDGEDAGGSGGGGGDGRRHGISHVGRGTWDLRRGTSDMDMDIIAEVSASGAGTLRARWCLMRVVAFLADAHLSPKPEVPYVRAEVWSSRVGCVGSRAVDVGWVGALQCGGGAAAGVDSAAAAGAACVCVGLGSDGGVPLPVLKPEPVRVTGDGERLSTACDKYAGGGERCDGGLRAPGRFRTVIRWMGMRRRSIGICGGWQRRCRSGLQWSLRVRARGRV